MQIDEENYITTDSEPTTASSEVHPPNQSNHDQAPHARKVDGLPDKLLPANQGSQVPRKLRRTVIKEELIAVTGDPMSAAVLNYFIECTEYSRRIDEFIEGEKSQLNEWAREDFCVEPTEGWVRRASKDLAKELMLGAQQTTRSHVAKCVRLGLIEERRNPHNKFDSTKQYRVNFDELRRQLAGKGYSIDAYAQPGLEPTVMQ